MMSPEAFKKRFNIQVRINSEVTKILRDQKCVLVKDLLTGEEYRESYGKLVLSPGAEPVRPASIPGINSPHVFTVRNVTDTVRLKNYIDSNDVRQIVVAGGGFIGMEIAENLVKSGRSVSLIEGASQVMLPFDEDIVQILHKEAIDHGISLYLNSMVSEIGDGFVRAVRGGEIFEIKAQAVVMAIGAAPETTLAKDAGLETGETKGIKVNNNYQTNDPDIYAVGGVIEVYNRLTRRPGRLVLAGPAQRQARSAADHIYGQNNTNAGVIGSCCLRFFTQKPVPA